MARCNTTIEADREDGLGAQSALSDSLGMCECMGPQCFGALMILTWDNLALSFLSLQFAPHSPSWRTEVVLDLSLSFSSTRV
jgi:hypothetical protein